MFCFKEGNDSLRDRRRALDSLTLVMNHKKYTTFLTSVHDFFLGGFISLDHGQSSITESLCPHPAAFPRVSPATAGSRGAFQRSTPPIQAGMRTGGHLG